MRVFYQRKQHIPIQKVNYTVLKELEEQRKVVPTLVFFIYLYVVLQFDFQGVLVVEAKHAKIGKKNSQIVEKFTKQSYIN